MKKFLSLVTVFALLGCGDVSADVNSKEYEFKDCVFVSEGLYRCENKEVVCYLYEGYKKGGLSCQFKELTNEN